MNRFGGQLYMPVTEESMVLEGTLRDSPVYKEEWDWVGMGGNMVRK